MSRRTDATRVKAIYSTSLTNFAVESYIDVAADIVDELDSDTTLGDTRLELIERYLTAHLIAFTNERIGIREKIGDAEITYAGKFGEEIMGTPWGQTAAMLDTSGTLRSIGKRKISIKAITSFDT